MSRSTRLLTAIALAAATSTAQSQQVFRDSSIFAAPISLDSVSVKATRAGWDIGAFIRRVQRDTTFYKAFRGLRTTAWRATNDIRMYDKEGGIRASLYSHTIQHCRRGCRSMQVADEKVTGDFYTRRGDYRYFTAGMYAHLFFTADTVCGETDVIGDRFEPQEGGALGRSKAQLEQLIFRPGSKVRGVPFIGDRASIFEPDVAPLYDFKLSSVLYNGEACWLFRAIPRPAYERDVVFNELSTWFRKSDYAILARDYALSYHTLAFDFDVKMQVRLTAAGTKQVPARIDYDGNWHIPAKQRERVKFSAVFVY